MEKSSLSKGNDSALRGRAGGMIYLVDAVQVEQKGFFFPGLLNVLCGLVFHSASVGF